VASSFRVTTYVVQGNTLLSTNILVPLLSRHTGANVSLDEIVKAATELHEAYRKQGFPMMSVAIPRNQITNGVVTLNVFETALPQIVVSGVRFVSFTNGLEMGSNPLAVAPVPPPKPLATNAPGFWRSTPATPAEIAAARAALLEKAAFTEAAEKDTRIHVVSTNAGPHFTVEKYLITGNSALTPAGVAEALTNIDGAFGTNVSVEGVKTVVEQLQQAYKERGYVTVAVDLPQQKLTNATVKVQVLEGRLAAITVTGNRYFSSNNVMRALPSLHRGMLLNGPVFQAELNRANADQDRQIYPLILPGPVLGTSALQLKVDDRLPLHGKLELNDQSSPGTPDLRVNGSVVANNLWQQENSLGIQYGFSPEQYKQGNQWPFYDTPALANYGAFYRLPLGNEQPIENIIANNPGNFGYDEATHKFNLPPPSGRPDLTFFASRATIDAGLMTTLSEMVTTNGANPSISRQDVEDSQTVNQDIGARLNLPLPTSGDFQSSFSGGLDFKTYYIGSYKTNIFSITQTNFDTHGQPILPPVLSVDNSAVPATVGRVEYLPLTLHYDASWRDSFGTASFGLGLTFNPWFSSSTSITPAPTASVTTNNGVVTTNYIVNATYLRGAKSIQNITGSTESSGYWVVLNPSFTRNFVFYKDWTTIVRADGQWASEPLISSEQFGIGGVNSVRGYHEGEVFGDTGWHVSLEQQTPPLVVGTIHGNTPLTASGSVYMDYARVYLLDPQTRPASTALWGTGFGITASAGPDWQARFLFSWPLISTSTTPAFQPYFNFALTAQF